MAITKFLSKGFPGVLLGWLSRLRFPYLFLLTSLVFIINLVVPDVIPFIDEIIMGLAALLLAKLRKKPVDKDETKKMEKAGTSSNKEVP